MKGLDYYDICYIFAELTLRFYLFPSVFLVGAGALGCEFMKMFALMGVATDASGLVSVTDDENIEIANSNG